MKINILGQDYEILKLKSDERMEKLQSNGLCEQYAKQILIYDSEETIETFLNMKEFKNRVLRHEIMHAFLFESGLGDNCTWARNEEMVDFFAIQIPKIVKVMQDADCLKVDSAEIPINWKNVQVGTPMLVRNDPKHEWEIRSFSCYKPENDYPYEMFAEEQEDGTTNKANYRCWKYCILRKGNEHLLNTK